MTDMDALDHHDILSAVNHRGALPRAPLSMPPQRLERRRRLSRWALFMMVVWGRPARAGR